MSTDENPPEQTTVICWKHGPSKNGCVTTCMLPAGHTDEHAFQCEDQITLQFTDTGETFTMAEARVWHEKWKADHARQ